MGKQADGDDVVLARWNTWIEAHWGNLIYLCEQREIVHDTMAALERQGENHVFANMLFQMYVRYQSIGVRRLIDRGQDTYSLRRLMDEALAHRHLLSRHEFVRAHVEAEPDLDLAEVLADRHYDDLWGAGSPEPSEEAIKADIDLLVARTDAVRKFASWTQAHMLNKTPDPISLAHLEQAVDDVVQMFQKWAMTVTHKHLEVTRLGAPDWRDPFRIALFDDRPLPPWPPDSPNE